MVVAGLLPLAVLLLGTGTTCIGRIREVNEILLEGCRAIESTVLEAS